MGGLYCKLEEEKLIFVPNCERNKMKNNLETMVSVICPTYNQAHYMREGLESILMQKVNFRMEILIGEDCSPDNTNEILDEYEKKYPDLIQVFHREKNLKQSKNVYDLFMHSSGKYIIILDLDDYWTDEYKLQKQVDFLENHPEYIGTAHNYTLIDGNGQHIERENRAISEYLGKEFHLQDFLSKGFVYQTGTFCYSNIWKEDKDWSILYRADKTVVDLTINLILLQRKPVFIMEDTMSVYREVVSADALNFRSVCVRDKAKDFEQMAKHLETLDDYFEHTVDLSDMWSTIVIDYFKGTLKRASKNYKLSRWFSIYRKSSRQTKNIFKEEITKSIKRNVFKRKV